MSLAGLDLLLAAELDPLLRPVAVDGNPVIDQSSPAYAIVSSEE
jgi:hypothetical protein